MRVIAGTYKGRKLESPENYDIRPTTDKAKEALFSILMNEIPGSRVLDLFAGSGALGIEALSRGAESCVFVDHSRLSTALIKRNLASCGVRGLILLPARKISPLSLVSAPVSILISVDFPAPFSPHSAWTSPARSVKLT